MTDYHHFADQITLEMSNFVFFLSCVVCFVMQAINLFLREKVLAFLIRGLPSVAIHKKGNNIQKKSDNNNNNKDNNKDNSNNNNNNTNNKKININNQKSNDHVGWAPLCPVPASAPSVVEQTGNWVFSLLPAPVPLSPFRMSTVCLSLDRACSLGAPCTALGYSLVASPQQERGRSTVGSFLWTSCVVTLAPELKTGSVAVDRWALVCQTITKAWLYKNSLSVGCSVLVEVRAAENIWVAPVAAPVVAPVAPVAFVAPGAYVAPVAPFSPVAPPLPFSFVAPLAHFSPAAPVVPVCPVGPDVSVSPVAFVAPVSPPSTESLPSSFSCPSLGTDDMEIDSVVAGVGSFWSLTFSSSSFLFPLLEQDYEVSPSVVVAQALAPFAAGDSLLSRSVPLSPCATELALTGEIDLEEVNHVSAVGSAVAPVAPFVPVSDVAFVVPVSPSSLSCSSLGGDNMEIDPVVSGVGSFWSLTFSSCSFLFPLLEQDNDVSPSAAVARALAPFAAGGALLSGSLSLSPPPVEPSLADDMDFDEVEPVSALGCSRDPVAARDGLCGFWSDSSFFWAADEPHYAEFDSVVPVGADFGFSGCSGGSSGLLVSLGASQNLGKRKLSEVGFGSSDLETDDKRRKTSGAAVLRGSSSLGFQMAGARRKSARRSSGMGNDPDSEPQGEPKAGPSSLASLSRMTRQPSVARVNRVRDRRELKDFFDTLEEEEEELLIQENEGKKPLSVRERLLKK
ncbi:uncharacterized protein EV154DRAFT_564018 [Mucor mucedo]|uniref:uncharacterized protein n=1 Tax=Mucor mucedo TaxID=29922 RepID=UPI00221E4E74|nr:uncharacterized protein EV154DRAFT_564018 [Mucor mucedo]KAI7890748.1 hypothetical protein EV154DRAFT_564018 [Mucor mucedo]